MKKLYISFVVLMLSTLPVFNQTPVWNWGIEINTNDNESANDVAINPLTGEIYVVGNWSSNLSAFFPTGTLPSENFNTLYGGNTDGFVAKYDNAGNFLWAFKIGCNRDDDVTAIEIAPSGDFYITGLFHDNTAEFTGTGSLTASTTLTNSDNHDDFFIAKYNSDGELVWVRQGYSSGNKDLSGIHLAAHNSGVFAVGYYNDDAAFGAITLPDNGQFSQPFLISYDLNGNEQWAVYGTSDNQNYNTNSYFNGVATDGINVYVCGNFKGATFDLLNHNNTLYNSTVNSNAGNGEIVLLSLSVGGAFNWMERIIANGHDEDRAILLDADSIYMTGGISNNANFPGYINNPVSSSGGMDIFLSSHSKIDGSTGWVNTISSTNSGNQSGMDITMDIHNNLLIAGYFDGNLDFYGTNLNSTGGDDGFIASFSNDGEFVWTKDIGSSGNDYAYGIASNSSDNVVVTGIYEDAVNLDGILLKKDGRTNIFIAQTDPCRDAVGGTAVTANSELCPGESTIITLSGSDGNPQWQSSPKNAGTWTNIAGATTASISVSPALSTDYRAILTPISCNNDTSTIVTININAIPTANISGNATICSGGSTGINITLTGSSPFDFSFTDGTTPISITNHILNTYTYNSSPTDTVTYSVTTITDANGCSNSGTGTATINVTPLAQILFHPSNKTGCPGSDAIFNVTAIGTDLSYQWTKNGINIPGATNPVLSLSSIGAADAATYNCVVSSTCGGPLTSDAASLTLYNETLILTQPSDEHLCTGDELNLFVTANGSNLVYQWKKDGINIAGQTNNILNYPSITTADIGIYTCYISGTCGVVESNPAQINIDAPIAITLNPVSKQACPGENISFTAGATGTSLSYQWQKTNVDIVGENSQSLVLNNVGPTDAANYRCVITSPCGALLNSSTATLTINTSTTITSQPSDGLECEGSNISFEVTTTGSDIVYQWYKDAVAVSDGGTISGSATNQLIITGLLPTDAGNYLCEVVGACGTINSLPANLIVDDNIIINTQPANISGCENDNISFTVVATGSNLSYQWQKNTLNIAGATNSILNLNTLSMGDIGDYRCIISNSCGQIINSNIGRLTINEATSITTHPSDALECIGQNINFSVSAIGSSLTYQWYKNSIALINGGNISGALTNNLALSNLDATDAGTYTCQVSGNCGTVISDPSQLTIEDNIVISSQPSDILACNGDNVNFNIIATGSNLSYQWQKNTVDIVGATNPILSLSNVNATDEDNYRCILSNICGATLISNSVNLSLYATTIITTQPLDATECIGQNTSFTLGAVGANLSYQWRKNGIALADGGTISGSSTNTLSIVGITAGDNGVYTCEAMGSCGTENSDPANLILNNGTVITVHPANQTQCEGSNAVFNISATGTNLSYQWQKDGLNIPGAINSGLILSSVSTAESGIYRCIVVGDCGSSTSNGALLTVSENVIILSQPTDAEICENQSAGFSITTTGTDLNYQWRYNGTDIIDGGNISGSNTTNLGINPANLTNSGAYSCVVTGTCSDETSNTVSLTINENIVISSHPSNKTACPGDNIIFNVTASGTNLSYQWQKNGVDIGGASGSSIILNNVSSADAALYRCIISGACGTEISNGATLTVNQDVSITSEPADLVVCTDDAAAFTVNVLGTGLSYQWKRSGVDLFDDGTLTGANTHSLDISPADLTHSGAYNCVITGTCGSQTSSPAILTVNESITITSNPQNKTACPGDDIVFNVTATGANLSYQWQLNGGNIPGETGSGILINSVTSTNSGTYRCIVSGNCGSSLSTGATLVVYEDVLIGLHPVDKSLCEGSNGGFVISAIGSGISWQWKKNGLALTDGGSISGTTTNSLSINPVTQTEDGIYSCEVTGYCGAENSNPANLIVQSNLLIVSNPLDIDACVGEDVSFSISATGANLSYQWQKEDIDIPGETNAGITLLNVSLTDAGEYRCTVTGNCGMLNSDAATLNVDNIVTITTQPTPAISLCEGSNLNLNISATGTSLSYQWEKDGSMLTDGGNISGSSTNNLIINSVSTTNDGIYTCDIIGTCGSENSTISDVTINPSTSITTQPTNYTIVEGGNASFSIVATGSGLSYQWQKNGVNLFDGGIYSGTTTTSLDLTAVSETDEGAYRCIVTGTCNNANSNPANLTVNPTTNISTHPSDITRCEDESASFSVSTVAGTFSFQWQKDGINLTNNATTSGVNTANLSISNVSLSDAGAYTCFIDAESSAPAILTVNENITITNQPVSSTKCEGDILILTLTANGSSLNYQWQKDGVNISDGGFLSGSSTPTLTINPIASSDAGIYRCIVSGTCGTATSSPANVTVNTNTTINTQPVGNTLCEGLSHTFTFDVSGTNLTYLWKKDGVSLTDGGNISGTSTSNLTISSVSGFDAGSYTCSVTGSCGNLNSTIAQLIVNTTTSVTLQPVNETGCEGDNISYSILAEGSTLSYQWQQNGSNLTDGGSLSGTQSNNLTITGIVPADAGSYVCIISGVCGTQNSDPALLSSYSNTLITSQPTGSIICEGQSVALNLTATGDNLTYQWKKGGVDLSNGGNISGVNTSILNISNANLSENGTYSCEVTGSCGSINSNLADIDIRQNTSISMHPLDVTGCDGDNVSFSVVADGDNNVYQWQKDGVNLSDGGTISGSSTVLLNINSLLPTDAGAYRCVVTGTCNSVNSNPSILTSYLSTSISSQPIASTTICEGDATTLSVSAVGESLSYQWSKNSTPLSDGGNISGSVTSNLTLSNAATSDFGTYTVEVVGSCNNVNSSFATINVDSSTKIITHPTSTSGCEGDNISFAIQASGKNLTYQWVKDGINLINGGNISGSNSSILNITGIVPSDNGAYRCIVSGDCGTQNSNLASLNSFALTSITSQPLGASICEGNQANLTISATGNNINYQWKKDGVDLVNIGNISGATSSGLLINAATTANAGIYTCEVSGSCGTENSLSAILIVRDSTIITLHPQNKSVCENDIAVFSVNATGNAINYLWYKDGAPLVDGGNIFGSSTQTLALNNLTAADAGAYYCIITGSCGIKTSDAANLIVDEYPNPAGIIIGPGTVCQGDSSVIFEIPAISNASSYSWSLPVGINILSGTDTRLIEVSFSDNELGGNITVQGINACGSGTLSPVHNVIAHPMPTVLAGADQNICNNSTVLDASIPGSGSGIWSVIAGPGIPQNATFYNTSVSNLRQGANLFEWSVTQNGCTSSDTVTITNNEVTVEAGNNQTICSESLALEGSTIPSGATGNWSVISGVASFADGTNPLSSANGFASGLNILKWTISNGSCSDYDTVIIDNQRPTQAYAGINQSLCLDSAQLSGNLPIIGAGNWTVINGAATFNNPALQNAKATNLAKGTNILRWTITNGICSSIDEVTISNNKLIVDAGVDQVLCDRTADLDAVPALTGTGNWSVIQGSAVFVNNNLFNTRVTGLSKGLNTLGWNINNNGCISTDTVTITNDSPSDSDAGEDQVLSTDFTTLQGNIPVVGSGVWSLISGSAVIASPTLYNTNVTTLALGENTFRWTITNNSCISEDDVIINNFTPSTTDAGPDQTICFSTATLAGNEPLFGFGEWSVIQGSATFTNNSQYNTTVTGLAPGDNTLRWTVWENGYTSDDVVISNDSPSQANAGLDQTICNDSTTLSANEPLKGTASWTILSGSGQFSNDTLFNTPITNLAKGENIFRWTLTNKSCSSTDLVVVNNDLPTTAYAGLDQTICENILSLNPNTPTVGSGVWSVTSGAATFVDNEASQLASGDNILRWTISNNLCTSYDELTVTNNSPSPAQAGADKTVCIDSITLAANTTAIGTGIWSLQSGSGSIDNVNSATSKVTSLGQGLNVFRWTVSFNGCTNIDEVVINNALMIATTGLDQELCSETTVLEANNPGTGTGTWSVLGGSGSATFEDPNQPDTRVSNLDQGANILRWTITNSICESQADVVINNNLPTVSYAGPDQSLCIDNTNLQANEPLVGAGEWTILSGSAIIDNSSNAKSLISNLENGVNTLRWTISNKGCTYTDEVVVFNNATVSSNAGVDQVICNDSVSLYANNPPAGIGQWSVVSGSATFIDNNNYNTQVVNLGQGANIIRWLITNGGCISTDDVVITNNSPSIAIAGADRTICGNNTNLFANIPDIGIGEWQLTSGSATFDDKTLYNTTVTNLNPGENTLRWLIMYEGCISYDDIIITNDLPYVADAGMDMELCESTTSLYANDPITGSGQWSIISGSATFDDPSQFDASISDIGFGTNKLRWTINYDQCSAYDEVLVTNNQIQIYAGVDQVVGEQNTFLAANNPTTGNGEWTVIGGSGTFTEPGNFISEVTNLGAGLNTFRWSVNISNCISYDDISVTYNVPPEASFVVSNQEGCPPHEVYFVNNSLDNLPFTWDFGDGTTSTEITVKHVYTEAGEYIAILTVIGEAGELITTEKSITVYEQPIAGILVVNREVYIPDEEALFINQSTYGSIYAWDFGDGSTSSEHEPRHIYETPGNFDITLEVWSDKNCYDSVKIKQGVIVLESGTIEFPNAFTPNLSGPGDGTYNENDFSNDVFFPVGDGINQYHLEVFNKWGILVFESNDITIGWDGYYNEKLLEEGVYVYKVTGLYNNGRDFKKVGTVLLLH